MNGTFFARVTKTTAKYPVYQVVISKRIAEEMKLQKGDTVKVTIEKIGTEGVTELSSLKCLLCCTPYALRLLWWRAPLKIPG